MRRAEPRGRRDLFVTDSSAWSRGTAPTCLWHASTQPARVWAPLRQEAGGTVRSAGRRSRSLRRFLVREARDRAFRREPDMRRLIAALVLVAGAVALAGCGSRAFPSGNVCWSDPF